MLTCKKCGAEFVTNAECDLHRCPMNLDPNIPPPFKGYVGRLVQVPTVISVSAVPWGIVAARDDGRIFVLFRDENGDMPNKWIEMPPLPVMPE